MLGPTIAIVWTGATRQRGTSPMCTQPHWIDGPTLTLSAVRPGSPQRPDLTPPTEPGASAHHLAAELAELGVSCDMGGSPLLGHVEPAIAAALEQSGYAVHRVGQAAYVHGPVCPGATPGRQGSLQDDRRPAVHLIVGVWRRREPAPSWAARLGNPSAGYERRWARQRSAQAWRRLHRRPNGRWAGPLPWWRWPGVQPYRWDPIPPSLFDLERDRETRSTWPARTAAPLPPAPVDPLLALLSAWAD